MSAKIEDIFSMLREEELPLRKIEEFFLDDYEGKVIPKGYAVIRDTFPANLGENQVLCARELMSEGKKVAFLLLDGEYVSTIGYYEHLVNMH